MRYRLGEGVLRADLEGQEVLLNPETGMYHILNPTARRLIAEMEAGSSIEDAVRDLAEATGEPHERIARDAHAFLDAMLSRRLLEAAEL